MRREIQLSRDTSDAAMGACKVHRAIFLTVASYAPSPRAKTKGNA